MGWLDGQVALVTGGGSGIGRAVVARFVEEGARVAVMDRLAGRGEALKAEFGDKVAAIAGDVARLDDNKRAVAETVAVFGRLDIFVGNAGVLDGFVPLAEIAEDSLAAACDELFAINVKGCILGAKATLPELTKTQGCMIFTASGAGFTSAGGGVIYTASKHAVVGIIRQLAVELGPADPGQRRRARRHDDRSAQCRGIAAGGSLAIRHSRRPRSGSPPATRCGWRSNRPISPAPMCFWPRAPMPAGLPAASSRSTPGRPCACRGAEPIRR